MTIKDIQDFINNEPLIKDIVLNVKKPGLLKHNIPLLNQVIKNSRGMIRSNSELIYLLRNKDNLDSLHIFCKCGNKNNFINQKCGYCTHCSVNCDYHKKDKLVKMQKSCLDKYGVKNPYQIKQVKKKALDFYKDFQKVQERNKKIEQTKFSKYGYKCNFSSKDTKLNGRATCKKKYGNEEIFKTNHFKEATKNTYLNKYGTTSFSKTPQFKDLFKNKEWSKQRELKKQRTLMSKYGCKNTNNVPGVKEKRLQTLHKNNSFNKSCPEENCYGILKDKFPDTIRQYKDERYPFNCDFYIPSKDLFIECNFHWTHGGEPFDENNQQHIKRLEFWRSKDTVFYKKAEEVWTKRDKDKIKTFIDHNLNHKIFYTEEEFIEWINNL